MQDWNHIITSSSSDYTLEDIYKQQELGDVYSISIDSGHYNYYNNQHSVNLKGIQTLLSLHVLFVNGCHMPCVDLAIICALPNLEVLNLKHNSIRSFRNFSARNASVKTADFSRNLITDLKFAQSFVNIEEINVRKNHPNYIFNPKDEEQQFLILNSIHYLAMHPNLKTINLGFGDLVKYPHLLSQNKYSMPDISKQIDYITEHKPVSESPFQQEIKSMEVRACLNATDYGVKYIREARKRRDGLRENVSIVRAKLTQMLEILQQFE